MTRFKSRKGSQNRKPELTQRNERFCLNSGERSGRHKGDACREPKPVCETCSDGREGCKMDFEKCDGRHRKDACNSCHAILKRLFFKSYHDIVITDIHPGKIKKGIFIEDKPILREKPKAVDQGKCCGKT
jgi:hypothetical protein